MRQLTRNCLLLVGTELLYNDLYINISLELIVVHDFWYLQHLDNVDAPYTNDVREDDRSWSLTGATPISAAKISVICKNQKNQVSYYKAFATNANGYFYAQLDGFKMENNLSDHPLQSCQVKLVSSPLQSCNLLTNVNYGLDGSPLRYEKKSWASNNYEAVIYAAGPLAFHPAYCTPSTHN